MAGPNRSNAQWDPRLLADLYASAAPEAEDARGIEVRLATLPPTAVAASSEENSSEDGVSRQGRG